MCVCVLTTAVVLPNPSYMERKFVVPTALWPVSIPVDRHLVIRPISAAPISKHLTIESRDVALMAELLLWERAAEIRHAARNLPVM